jgi:hypothetical protein
VCACPLTPNGKGRAHVQASGEAAEIAAAVTRKFCQARLVNAGLLDPPPRS